MGVRALDGTNLSVARGEWVAITGPSGSGKSTLLHLIAALDQPTDGAVRINGQDLRDVPSLDRYRRDVVGLVFQLHNLLPHLDARRNIEIAMFGTHRSRRQSRLRGRSGRVDLADKADRKPPELSGGGASAGRSCALANKPEILLADEPTGSLDPASVEQTLELFRHLRADHGITIVMVTHDRYVASRRPCS